MTTTDASRRSDQEMLRERLERIVTDQFGASPTAIEGIERKRSEFSSFYASDIITVRLANGEQLKVFLKDFGSFHHPKDSMSERRDREMVVYRDLLANSGLDTPRYYGSVRDEAQGLFWLLLEFVEGIPMSHLDFEDWIPSAAWLGRMYGYFAKRPELWENCGALARHDDNFFQSLAQDALRTVSEYSRELGRRLEPIVSRYDKPVRVMTSQPRTLVHATYRPPQIIVDKSRRPMRICPVDYEKAAVGASLYDLTFIADGFEPRRLHRLFDAYREEARRWDLRVPDNQEMTHVVNCFRLHRVMGWLAVSMARKYEDRIIHKLTRMAEEVGSLVL